MNSADDIQVVTFRVGPQEFALDISQVERILRYEKPAALPRAPEFLEGVVRYEGSAIPVVDLRKRLELEAALTEETRLMVLSLDGQRIGMLVDQVREVIRVDSTTITAPPPMVRGLAATYIAGIITEGERTVVLLNALRLLTSTERQALATATSRGARPPRAGWSPRRPPPAARGPTTARAAMRSSGRSSPSSARWTGPWGSWAS